MGFLLFDPFSIVDELTGHAIQGESFGRYGKPYRLKTLMEEGALKLSYKVDLSHLKSSKWVPKGKIDRSWRQGKHRRQGIPRGNFVPPPQQTQKYEQGTL